ncbi:MAG: GIY-YIG nuclease family protein [Candidatus Omnitrophica bacterium]|nr:GIY-YIG nuclease family protein [Candidatus Omnitrophota bacterium]
MIIYKAINKINGKIYIGQTVGSLGKRITEHCRSSVGFFSRALRKYGREGFDFEIIENCESRKELSEREIYWIGFFGCKYPVGYNLTDGGENPPSQKGRKRTEETKRKLKGKRGPRGCKRSEETRAKMAAAKIGNAHSLGCKRTDETKEKMRVAMTGKTLSLEQRRKCSAAATIRMQKYPMPWGMWGIHEKKPKIVKNAQMVHENISKAAKARALKFPMPCMIGKGKLQLLQRQQSKEVNAS